VGCAAAGQFDAARAAYVILDQHMGSISAAEEQGQLFIEGDATQEQLLLDAGIKRAKGLLALLGSDPENVFLVLSARELNPTLHIIARASDPHVGGKLLKAGADSIISPFTTAGIQVANEMLQITGAPDPAAVRNSFEGQMSRWLKIAPREPLVDKSVAAAETILGGAILGLRRKGIDTLMPGADLLLVAHDELLVATANDHPPEESAAQPQADRQVVIVDDNPVIVKLYTRLFQKAGFTPHIAADGPAGFDMITHLKPQAAVIDFQLPVYSGIEIVRRVRANADLNATRLILFTADDNAVTRERAMEAGADAVVVKSPEAKEVIETVIRIIS
jgi:voltage-gated potassium channel